MDSETVYLGAAVFLTIISLLQHWTDFYSKIKTSLIYRISSLFLMIGIVYEFAQYITWNPDPDLILIAGAHLFVFLSIIAIIFIVAWDDLIKGILFAGAFAAVHELVWNVGFLIMGAPLSETISFDQILVYYADFFILLVAILFALIMFFGYDAFNKVYTGPTIVILAFTVAWMINGFPTTLTLAGQTTFFHDFWVNLYENTTWVVMAAVLIIRYLWLKRASAKGFIYGQFD